MQSPLLTAPTQTQPVLTHSLWAFYWSHRMGLGAIQKPMMCLKIEMQIYLFFAGHIPAIMSNEAGRGQGYGQE